VPDIELTERSVRIDGDEFGYDEVTGVSYYKHVVGANFSIAQATRRFDLHAGERRVSLKLDGVGRDRIVLQERWALLVAVSQQVIEPRLRDRALARLRDGETVTINRLSLNASGFSWQGRLRASEHRWSEFVRTRFKRGYISVFANDDGGRERMLGEFSTDATDAVLVPKLMIACAAEFGTD
jgi:hypothetical protein